MNIIEATKSYEQWLAQQTPIDQADLSIKHDQMRDAAFTFLRATYYRWAQVWPKFCPELASAPEVLSIGDLHIENFGTWRDAEGRLIWGVNDFDEASLQSYANDLVRLAVSAHFAIEASHLHLSIDAACRAIIEGYQKALKDGGQPYVLAENHAWLRKAAVSGLRDPVEFWEKLNKLSPSEKPIPASAREALEHLLPKHDLPYRVVHRIAGEGSLGRMRFTALADWDGGQIAREAKALVRSASVWAKQTPDDWEIFYTTIATRAIRCSDPFFQARGQWVVRRLAPDCTRVELVQLPPVHSETALLNAMGYETGNIHLGSPGASKHIAAYLKKADKDWLLKATDVMSQSVLKDWNAWRKA